MKPNTPSDSNIAKESVIQKDVSVIPNARMLRNSFNFSIINRKNQTGIEIF